MSKLKIYRKRLRLEDLGQLDDEAIRKHWVSSWNATPEEVSQFNPVAAYESVGSWGCDSSGWFLLQDRKTGQLFEVHGSHCSCYGFEDQFRPEPTTLEYLKSANFGLSCGGYDNDPDANREAVKNFLATL